MQAVTAALTVTDGELSVVQAEADQLVALIALHQATGGGWGSEGGETG